MGIFGFLFDTESKYGRLMAKVGIIVVTNLMFLFFSIPFFTIGASFTAMYHVMLKELRSKNDINPFTQFWHAFKSNFRQSTICWLLMAVFFLTCLLGTQICMLVGGLFLYIEIIISVIGIVGILIALYLFPTIAAFANSIRNLFRNAIFFVGRKIWIACIVLIVNVIPMALTFLDKVYQPMYVFCWFFFGFGLISFVCSWLLLKVFTEFLPNPENFEG